MSDEAAWIAIRREVRILRWVICFMAVVLGALAYQHARPGVLRGTQLQLVDEDGRTYALIHRTERAANLGLLDRNGMPVVGLVAASDGGGGLVGLLDPNGNLTAGAVTADDGAAALAVLNPDGETVWCEKGAVSPKADPGDEHEPPSSQPSAPSRHRFNLNSKLSAPDPSPSSSAQGTPPRDPNSP